MSDETQQPPAEEPKVDALPCAAYICPQCERTFFLQLPDLFMVSVCPFCQKPIKLPNLGGAPPPTKVM